MLRTSPPGSCPHRARNGLSIICSQDTSLIHQFDAQNITWALRELVTGRPRMWVLFSLCNQ